MIYHTEEGHFIVQEVLYCLQGWSDTTRMKFNGMKVIAQGGAPGD